MTADLHSLHGGRSASSAPPLPLPSSIEAEQALLGALLLNNGTLRVIASHVDEDDFLEPIHRAIYDVASTLIGEGKAATPATLRPFLGERDLGEGMTIPRYLAHLTAEALPPVLAAGHAQLLRSLSSRRKLAATAADLDQRARNNDVHDDPAAIAAECMLDLQRIAAASGQDTTRSIAHFSDQLMGTVDGVLSGLIANRVITSGYSDFDKATSGYVPGTFVIVAGRPGMGKSGFVSSSSNRCARAGIGVLEFPLEIGADQMTARHLADLAYRGVERSPAFRDIGLRASEMDEGQLLALRDAHTKLCKLPIEIDSRSRVTLPQIVSKVAQTKRAMRSRGIELGVVFIDHLDFIAAGDRYRGLRTQEIGEIAIGLKDIARSQDVCVVLCCQLSREVEKRSQNDRRPTLADLRNSGDLEQVADVVAFLYREEYYLTRTADYLAGNADAINAAIDARGKLEVILGKVRAGPTPTIRLWCDMASSSISSFERGRA